MMDDSKLKSLSELIDAIKIGLDIEIDLFGVRYYIGSPQGELLISWNNGEDEVLFKDVDQLLNYKIKGKPIKDVWREIEIYAM